MTNSRYASSTTTRQSDGTRASSRSTASRRTAVLVGLFGEQTKMQRVRSPTRSAIASRSYVSSRSAAVRATAPACIVRIGYASNDGQL